MKEINLKKRLDELSNLYSNWLLPCSEEDNGFVYSIEKGERAGEYLVVYLDQWIDIRNHDRFHMLCHEIARYDGMILVQEPFFIGTETEWTWIARTLVSGVTLCTNSHTIDEALVKGRRYTNEIAQNLKGSF